MFWPRIATTGKRQHDDRERQQHVHHALDDHVDLAPKYADTTRSPRRRWNQKRREETDASAVREP